MSDEKTHPGIDAPIADDEPSVSFGTKKARKLTLEYLFDLRHEVESMRASRRFEVTSFELHEPAPDVLVEMMEAGLGHSVPEAVLSFFQRVSDGIDLRWSYYDDAGELQPGGGITVHNFGRVFGNWIDELWGNVPEDASTADEDFSWEIRAIETVDLDSTYMTVLHVPEDNPDYTLYFHSPGGSTHRLDVDFIEYFECLLQTRGFTGWQFLVSDVDFDTHPEARAIAERFHALMPTLFPDEDFSDYRRPHGPDEP